jgi:hypothetical protein
LKIDSEYIVHFFTTEDPALAAYLVYLNYKLEVLQSNHGTRPLFEFFESHDLLAAIAGYEQCNGGFKRLQGLTLHMAAIMGVRRWS